MGSDFALSYSSPPTIERLALAFTGFAVLLLLIFVGLGAFQPSASLSAHDALARYTSFLATFILIAIAALQRRGLGALSAIPPSVLAFFCWCLASALWSAEPHTVLIRAGFEIGIAVALFLGVDALSAERAFRIWRWLLAGILLVNFLSIPLIPAARHLAADGPLAGDWRGLYGHKDVAAAVCAITAILFFFGRAGWRNCVGIAIALAACVFLVMTRSRSALAFLPPALIAGLIYRAGWRDGLSRAVLATGGVLLLAAVAAFLALDGGGIAHALEAPQQFAGRAAALEKVLAAVRARPLLGSGFGTFDAGPGSYLQLIVTIGGIGFALAMLALVVSPFRRFWALDWDENAFRPTLLALLIFLLLQNFVETDLQAAGVNWAALVLVIAALAQRERYSLSF